MTAAADEAPSTSGVAQRLPGAGLAALSLEALDFAPGLLAIQVRPPARLPRAVLLMLVVLVALLLLWSVFARIDIIASAEGRLVPASYSKVVQPAEAGVVSEVLVAEGDAVREGQVLMRLDPRLANADTGAVEREVWQKRLGLRRIEAELKDRPFVPLHGDPPELVAHVQAQFLARRRVHDDAQAHEREALAKALADLNAARQVLAKLQQTLPLYQQSAAAYRKLVGEGFVGELAAADKAREAIEKEQDLRTQGANVVSLEASVAQSVRRLASLDSQYRSQLENERVELVSQINRSMQEFEKATLRAGMLEVRAPHAGVVKDLAVTNRGAVVSAGGMLLNIVPQGEALQADVLLKNEDIGFVAVGQMAMLKVAAYPFQNYGLMEGRVSLVGADTIESRLATNAQQPPLTYRAVVSIARPALIAPDGSVLALSPGMLVTAEVHQGRRSVLDYLLSPVRRIAQEAGRER